jgi:hypothetical protein
MAVTAATIGAVESMSIGQPVAIGPQLWSQSPSQAAAEIEAAKAEA